MRELKFPKPNKNTENPKPEETQKQGGSMYSLSPNHPIQVLASPRRSSLKSRWVGHIGLNIIWGQSRNLNFKAIRLDPTHRQVGTTDILG